MEKLYGALALQPGQHAAWALYVARVDAYLQLSYREKPVQATDTAPRQLARLVDRLQNQLAALEDMERAGRELYLVLSPDQRLQADQLLLASLPSGVTGVATPCAPESPSRTNGPRPGRGGGMPPGGGGGGGGF